MLKLAESVDEDRILELILNFYEAANLSYGAMEVEKVRGLVQSCTNQQIPSNVLICWTEDGEVQGILAGQITDVIFNSNRVATELVWWCEPKYRKTEAGQSLLGAFEYWARKNGCKFVQMVGLQNEYAPVLDRYYKQKGYSPAENSYVKEI